ncbi:transposase [Nocardioides daphniae]|nr:transposase [Nocardioides daphniae]QCC78649.1 transposase [Nocardioides daphniae]
MRSSSTPRAVVLTVDQRGSRRSSDAVPAALALLEDLRVLRSWERTAGDEMQGILDSPAAVTAAVARLVRDGRWHVGIGIGDVESPLPDSTRAGRGEAYVAARTAVGAARTAPHHLRVEGDSGWCRHLESALWLWAGVLERRSAKGWEVVDLLADGGTYERVGAALGISQSAVSQRAAAAGLIEAERAAELATILTERALEAP